MKVTLLSLGLITLFCCTSDAPKAGPAKPLKTQGYLSQSDILSIVREADFVDMIFYTMDISVSQNDLASVQQTAQFFSVEGKPADMECPAIGRLSILSKGKIIKEADIHYKLRSCAYFTVIDHKKPVGTCMISAAGLKFFDSLIASYQPK